MGRRRPAFRSLLAAAVLTVGSFSPLEALAQPQNPAAEVARVEDLKSQAFEALKSGKFDTTGELLERANALRPDPSLARMAGWLADYRDKQGKVAVERRKEYDKAVAAIATLKANGFETYASDKAADAFLHADDKDAFRREAWVRALIDRTTAQAEEAEQGGQWLRARRLYGDLSVIEPTTGKWRSKFNDTSRRVTLLAMYAPDAFDGLLKTETADAEKVRLLLDPEAKPTTKPAEATDPSLRTDWKDVLSGVKVDMLREALEDARENYYRDTTNADMIAGGVKGLRQLVTTKGLEGTFPTLADDAKRQSFVDALDAVAASARENPGRGVVRNSIDSILGENRLTLGLPDEVLVYEFSNGVTEVLDPFTGMIWPSDVPDFLAATQGEFTGVGIQIQPDDEGFIKVISPIADSPAYKAGVEADSVITHINGKSAKGLSIDRAKKFIQGPQGTLVTLTIRSADGKESKDFALRRDTIHVSSIKGWTQRPGGSWDYLVDPENGIGYVRLTNFTKDTGKELGVALRSIRGQQGRAVIVDLRQNPGGLLVSAVEVVDRFLSKGLIVSTKSARNDVPTSPPSHAKANADDVTDLPMIVLVNQTSASASEIVSGALKDHQRALIVGERTYGKGSVQMLFPINQKQAFLKLTTSKYYLASNRSIHREEDSAEWGVEPDLKVEVTPEQMRAVAKQRQQLDVLRAKAANPATLPAEFRTPEEMLLASDPQLGAAVLLLRMQLAGAPLI